MPGSGVMMSAKRIGRVDAEPPDRLERDLGAQRPASCAISRRLARSRMRAVLGQRAAGLAHEPDRRRVDRLAPAGAQEPIVHAGHVRSAARAASTVASISAGPWAIETNQASNCEGGRRIPRSSIAPKNRAYASRSDASASAASSGAVGRKKTREQRADLGDRDLSTGRARPPRAVPTRVSAAATSSARYLSGVERGEGGDAGGHRQRMAGQRAGLVDRARGRDEVHQVGPAAVRPDRHPAADDLAQRGEVRPDAEPRLGAAGPEPEPGDHLVEDEQRAVGAGRLAQVLEEAGRRRRRPRCSRRPARR